MALVASEEYLRYLDVLKDGLNHAYAIASEARKMGFDPSDEVEIKIAKDVASRVEALVGPPGISKLIRELEAEGMAREDIAFVLAQRIASGEIIKGTTQQLIEQAVRTSVSVLTEGVLVAPTEGISKVEINSNPDGTNYVSIYFTGPIRSAGGTVAALAVALADHARRAAKIGDYRATDGEVERYVEEVNIYESRVAHLQYKPKDEDVRLIVRNCPVCIDGEPTTDDTEVSVHRDLPRVKTNKIRGGVPLVVCEGIAQKVGKVYKFSKKFSLGWDWLQGIMKIPKKSSSGMEVKPDWTYLEGLVAGRPVFAYPSAKGGFRLRYGKSRTNGLMAKNIHPATMILLDDFVAVGTHVKVERPGKGAVLSACDAIDPPIVRLKNGSVTKVKSAKEAREIRPDVDRILFLGDMLVAFGDFQKSAHPLIPSGWCEEWWVEECRAKGVQPQKPRNAKEAFEFAKSFELPLHPDYVYFWHDLTMGQLRALATWLCTGSLSCEAGQIRQLSIPLSPQASAEKAALEEIGAEHTVADGKVFISGEDAHAILRTLGIIDGAEQIGTEKLSTAKFDATFDADKGALESLSALCGVQIKARAPLYIGCRMGRPEKAFERVMDGSVNVLFPTGSPKNRSLTKIYHTLKGKGDEKSTYVELARFVCPNCHNVTPYRRCELCNSLTAAQNVCPKCKKYTQKSECCGPAKPSEYRAINIPDLLDMMKKKYGFLPEDLRGVKGLSSTSKIPERLEKGIFRAKHGVFVFRDGTSRFDASDVPLTHFKPKEIGASISKLREFGYLKDYLGEDLVDDNQVVLLKPQDIIVSNHGADYFIRVTKFLDDLLVGMYNMRPFYSVSKKEDLLGHLFLGLSPHTSSGVLVRLIGFTDANVGFGHPFFHAAKRRNADGDEDAIMLLMDALLNFSRKYLSESRGGTMDAPITLSTTLDPQEIDDEAYCMEIVFSYPLELYRAAERYASPGEVKIRTVKDVLGKPEQYEQMGLTHVNSSMSEGPLRTAYLTMDSIPEKIKMQFSLQKRIRAVDARDAAERLILSHFIPDLYGNLRAFSRQTFRCSDCNESYRRPPLLGKCTRPKCGGNLLLNINKGGIQKYLEISIAMADEFQLPDYLKQRLVLIEKEIKSIFEDEKVKQTGISDFM